jgi:hypothetical protein
MLQIVFGGILRINLNIHNLEAIHREVSMRMISLPVTFLLAISSSAALAQQSAGTTSDSSATFEKSTLPESSSGPGLNVVAPDGSTKIVKAVPCGTAARETDGFTTCVGIPDQSPTRKRRR